MHHHCVIRTEAGTELEDGAHHAPGHRGGTLNPDIIEAHLMKPGRLCYFTFHLGLKRPPAVMKFPWPPAMSRIAAAFPLSFVGHSAMVAIREARSPVRAHRPLHETTVLSNPHPR